MKGASAVSGRAPWRRSQARRSQSSSTSRPKSRARSCTRPRRVAAPKSRRSRRLASSCSASPGWAVRAGEVTAQPLAEAGEGVELGGGIAGQGEGVEAGEQAGATGAGARRAAPTSRVGRRVVVGSRGVRAEGAQEGGLEVAGDQLEGDRQVLAQVGRLVVGAGEAGDPREVEHPEAAAVAGVTVGDADVVVGLEGGLEGGERGVGGAAERLVAFAHDRKGVVVPAEPDVQAVLLDALAVGRVAAAGSLAAEAPAELIDGDLEVVLPVGGLGQGPGGRDGADASAEDGDAAAPGMCGGHRISPGSKSRSRAQKMPRTRPCAASPSRSVKGWLGCGWTRYAYSPAGARPRSTAEHGAGADDLLVAGAGGVGAVAELFEVVEVGASAQEAGEGAGAVESEHGGPGLGGAAPGLGGRGRGLEALELDQRLPAAGLRAGGAQREGVEGEGGGARGVSRDVEQADLLGEAEHLAARAHGGAAVDEHGGGEEGGGRASRRCAGGSTGRTRVRRASRGGRPRGRGIGTRRSRRSRAQVVGVDLRPQAAAARRGEEAVDEGLHAGPRGRHREGI
jgi:hypothetical protein